MGVSEQHKVGTGSYDGMPLSLGTTSALPARASSFGPAGSAGNLSTAISLPHSTPVIGHLRAAQSQPLRSTYGVAAKPLSPSKGPSGPVGLGLSSNLAHPHEEGLMHHEKGAAVQDIVWEPGQPSKDRGW